jgi:hypothetical protein
MRGLGLQVATPIDPNSPKQERKAHHQLPVWGSKSVGNKALGCLLLGLQGGIIDVDRAYFGTGFGV